MRLHSANLICLHDFACCLVWLKLAYRRWQSNIHPKLQKMAPVKRKSAGKVKKGAAKASAAAAKASAAAADATANGGAVVPLAIADAVLDEVSPLEEPLAEAEESEAESEAETASAAKRTLDQKTRNQNDMCTYFNRMKAKRFKKQSSDEDVGVAVQALKTFDGLQPDEKDAFVKLFLNNKASKDFGFVKEYSEMIASRTTVKEEISENYLTRIVIYA